MATFNRVLLKLSGEALAGNGALHSDEVIQEIARQIIDLRERGVSVGIVIGGGNIWRGAANGQIERTISDKIGMLATVVNCLYVSGIFRNEGLSTRVLTPSAVMDMTESFSKDKAVEYLDRGDIVFFAAGTGNPYFSTDTGVVLRALEVGADLVLLAKNIDGVYDADPKLVAGASKFETISLSEVVKRDLRVMDLSATIMARDNQVPLRVFSLTEPDSIRKAAGIIDGFSGTTVTVD